MRETTLTPIISKLSDMRVVSAELDILLYEPMKEFITMAILLIGNILLMYFLNKDWFHTLMTTAIGKGVLAVSAAALFVSMGAVIRLTRPIADIQKACIAMDSGKVNGKIVVEL